MNSNKSKRNSPPGQGTSKGARKRRNAKEFAKTMQLNAKKGPGPAMLNNNSLKTVGVNGFYQKPPVGFRSERPTLPGASVRLQGCDYVGVISTSSSAGVDTVNKVNPANTTLFPRLSAISAVFELYRFTMMRVILIGLAPTTQAGAATGVFQYDAGQSTGLTFAQVRNEEGQMTYKFWENGDVLMNCQRVTRPWFVVSDSDVEADDLDQAQFHIVTDETPSGAIPAFDMFVCYDVEFAQGQASGAPELGALRPFLRKKGAVEAILRLLEKSGVSVPKLRLFNQVLTAPKEKEDADVKRLLSTLLDQATDRGPDRYEQVTKAKQIATECQIEQLTALPVTSVPMQQVLTAVRSDEEQAAIRRLEAEVRESLERRKAAELIRLRAAKQLPLAV